MEQLIIRKPPGYRLIKSKSFTWLQFFVLFLTFFVYTMFHCTKKITSVVKSSLDPETHETGLTARLWARNGWAPFNGTDGTSLLGDIDLSFLMTYAVGMFFSGQLGDRSDLRLYLTAGMLLTALCTTMFGLGYWLNMHNFYYYVLFQGLAGLFQSTGWPSVVSVVGNWFGKGNRGLIMGLWNSHTSVGNMLGSLIGSYLLQFGWGWSFTIPSLAMALVAIVVFGFMPVSPKVMEDDKEVDVLLEVEAETAEAAKEEAISFVDAWKIPGVALFSFCLFFVKLVAYTFLFWLPFYLSHTAIGGSYVSDSLAGNLSIMFDIGGVFGGVLAGYISDKTGKQALTSSIFVYLVIPALWVYRLFGSVSLASNFVLLFIAGMFVNGPYALITTAVSADLGTHSSLQGNARALATVTSIIDGTGSVGAALGPLVTGHLASFGWDAVFYMLMVASFLAGLLLFKLVCVEIRTKRSEDDGSADQLSLKQVLIIQEI